MSSQNGEPEISFHKLSSGGEVGKLFRKKDWSLTAMGPMEHWPQYLHNYLLMIFEIPTAAIIFWGPDQIQLYNDGYSEIMGPRHPQHLGSTFKECWPEAYDAIYPWMRRVLDAGETVQVNRSLVPLTRHGFTEESYFSFTFSPLRDDKGKVVGILQLVSEVTLSVLGERRTVILRDLTNQMTLVKTTADAFKYSVESLAKAKDDFPFILIYEVENENLPTNQQILRRREFANLQNHLDLFPEQISAPERTNLLFPEIIDSFREKKFIFLENISSRFLKPELAPSSNAIIVPIKSSDQRVIALFVAGLSPKLRFDERYRMFSQIIADQIANLLLAARAHEDERKRLEALAEIDRTKTDFFNNVSHEFRTPLTLILGPIEESMRNPDRPLSGEALGAVHRNALRLLKLVNNLLDFARLESGNSLKNAELTDLNLLTKTICESFKSLIESSGLKFNFELQSCHQLFYIDQSHWEKILSNLISNAFKFTFHGQIDVKLDFKPDTIELTVSDTGIGISTEELPKIFERFHRVVGAKSRSIEGTGIGLALVKELAHRNNGEVMAMSEVGKGSTFVVKIKKPKDREIHNSQDFRSESLIGNMAITSVSEASKWLIQDSTDKNTGTRRSSGKNLHRVLIVDDNIDMREHLARILSEFWGTATAENGQQALEMILDDPPDLILSDISMPILDGIALVKAIRKNSKISTLPVILLSARVHEESVLGGLDSGADDYLVKPFTTKELLARIRTHLNLAKLRREWGKELEEVNRELEAFSYSVSHDLRAPIRTIDGFGKILLSDFDHQLDNEAKDYLRRICSATKTMGQLIDDLLSLSRITRWSLSRQSIDFSELSKKIFDELLWKDPNREVEIIVKDSIRALADPRLAYILLNNLINNSWKFTAKTKNPRIEVGNFLQDGVQVYFVKDNGAGFNSQAATKLFVPFHRFHTDQEFEGHGIGLATAHRIVQRHNGKIWADSITGKGASFFFTLGEIDSNLNI